MATSIGELAMEQPLNLPGLLQALQVDGLLPGGKIPAVATAVPVRVHPLVYLAELKLDDARSPGAVLGMDRLLAWLGARSGQSVYQIDPLKINVTAVAEVMSQAFAERHRILAVEVSADEVVIASADPYISGWEHNLEHVLRKQIRRVLADPRERARRTG